MVISNITMNLSALDSIASPNITLAPSGGFGLGGLIDIANSSSDNLLIFGSLFIILVIMYVILTDRSPFGDFGFDDLRGLNVALSSCTLIGLTLVSVGWSSNFFAVGMFGTAWLVSYILVLIYTNRE